MVGIVFQYVVHGFLFVSAHLTQSQDHGVPPFYEHGPCRMQFCAYNIAERYSLDYEENAGGVAWHHVREAVRHCIPAAVNGKIHENLFTRDINSEVACEVGYGYVGNALACRMPCNYYSGGDWDLSKHKDIANPDRLPSISGLCSLLASTISPSKNKRLFNQKCLDSTA